MPYTLPLTISEAAAPRMSITDAAHRLNYTRLAFVFFLDTDRARGSMLYRRYDGHFGLVQPAT